MTPLNNHQLDIDQSQSEQIQMLRRRQNSGTFSHKNDGLFRRNKEPTGDKHGNVYTSTTPPEKALGQSQQQRLLSAYGISQASLVLHPAAPQRHSLKPPTSQNQKKSRHIRPQSSKPPLRSQNHQQYQTLNVQEPESNNETRIEKQGGGGLLDFSNMTEEHIKEIANKAD